MPYKIRKVRNQSCYRVFKPKKKPKNKSLCKMFYTRKCQKSNTSLNRSRI